MTKICELCNKPYRMGYTGTVNGCDICLNIVRDKDGYFYELGESEIVLRDVETGVIETRRRTFLTAASEADEAKQ